MRMRARETARERDGFCVCRSVCVYVCACVHAYVSVCVCVYVWSDSVCRVWLNKAPQNKPGARDSRGIAKAWQAHFFCEQQRLKTSQYILVEISKAGH